MERRCSSTIWSPFHGNVVVPKASVLLVGMDRKKEGVERDQRSQQWTAVSASGRIGELFVNKETFDVYACPMCGSVEFFVDGIGEHMRPA